MFQESQQETGFRRRPTPRVRCVHEGEIVIPRTLPPTFSSSSSHTILKQAAGKAIILLDDHRTHCSSSVLLHTDVQNNVTIIRVPSYCTDAL
jgi:hypothetical protein